MSGAAPHHEAEPGGPLERDAPALPPEVAVEPRTGSLPDGNGSDSRDALRDDLTRLIEKVGLTPFEVEDWRLDELAGRLLTSGWRRVVEDDHTIERLAEAMWFGPPQWSARIVQLEYAPTWRAKARAVVRALREDT